MKRSAILILLVALVGCGGDGPRDPRLPPAHEAHVRDAQRAAAAREVRAREAARSSAGRPTAAWRSSRSVAVAQARKAHADAIINYNGSQRFGFWPWRFIRPVVTGDAVRIDNPEVFDCVKLGGEFYSEAGLLRPRRAGPGSNSVLERATTTAGAGNEGGSSASAGRPGSDFNGGANADVSAPALASPTGGESPPEGEVKMLVGFFDLDERSIARANPRSRSPSFPPCAGSFPRPILRRCRARPRHVAARRIRGIRFRLRTRAR